MKFLIYGLILFSFFHWLVGYGILGSIVGAIILVALTPFIMAIVTASVVAIWAGLLFIIGLVAVGVSELFSKLKK